MYRRFMSCQCRFGRTELNQNGNRLNRTDPVMSQDHNPSAPIMVYDETDDQYRQLPDLAAFFSIDRTFRMYFDSGLPCRGLGNNVRCPVYVTNR